MIIIVLLITAQLLAVTPNPTVNSIVYNPFKSFGGPNTACVGPSSPMTCSQDCKATGSCVNTDYVVLENCFVKPYCHKPTEGNAVCSTSARCYGAPLKCEEDGIFPDPFFCNFYHSCSGGEPYSVVLDCADSGYNIATGSCDVPLSDPVCDEPVPICTAIDQFGALAANPAYYYRCKADGSILYPGLQKCPLGMEFNEILNVCKDPICAENAPATVCSLDCQSIRHCPDDVVLRVCRNDPGPYCHHGLDNPTCSISPRCDGAPMICGEYGVFPDPYFCTKYHTCSGGDDSYSQVSVCVDSVYNIVTGACDLPPDDPVCDEPVPECTSDTQSGALARNRNLYYRCNFDSIGQVFYPKLYKCPEGQEFDENADECGTTTTPISTTTITTTTPTTTTPTTTTPTTTTPTTTTPIPTTTSPPTTDVCESSTGLFCTTDCLNIRYCPFDILADKCGIAGLFCHHNPSTDAECSMYPRCDGAPLKCANTGIFPDPYFCTKYHACSGVGYSDVFDCVDSAYNIATGNCDLPLDDPVCNGPVPECIAKGQTDALEGNLNYYYRCVEDGYILSPQLYKCPDGQEYDENIEECFDPSACAGVVPDQVCSSDCQAIRHCPDDVELKNCRSEPTAKYCYNSVDISFPVCSVSARCKGAALKCTEAGVFPDPYFCRYYHTCTDGVSYSEVHDCGKRAFNIATGACDLYSNDTVCLAPVPECTSTPQSGSLVGNTQYYYRCKQDSGILYPDLYKCPVDYTFNDGLDQCVENNRCEENSALVCASNCLSIRYCPSNQLIQNCADPFFYCYHGLTGNPSCSVSARCEGAPLKCAQDGVFPDPYFCKIFHTCSGGVGSYSEVHECIDSAYNIVTGECDLPLGAAVCDGPVPTCTSNTQFGALAKNPNYYFRCRNDGSIFYPDLYQCPDGNYFDENIDQCSTLITTSTTPAPTTLPPKYAICAPDCTNVIGVNDIPLECSNPLEPFCHAAPSTDATCSVSARCDGAPLKCGQAGQYPDPYFCTKYHSCVDDTGYSQVLSCGGLAYNIINGQCDLPLDDPVCDAPVPLCTDYLQYMAIPQNQQFYLICLRDSKRRLYPEIFMCADGEVFSEETAKCV